jgi:glycosyltransferase involved in cell wall biosynthesis
MENGLEILKVSSKKIALAHDFFSVWGGAERVFRVMTDMYPEAPIYTLFYDRQLVQKYFPDCTFHASFLQHWPKWLRESGFGKLFYPVAVETLDLREFDTVLSSSGAWMKGLVTRLHTRHIAYLHSPMRYVWDTFHSHPELRSGFRFFQRLALSYFRLWDKEAADRPDVLLVNSEYTRARVLKYYRRESTVVYPPTSFSVEKILPPRERKGFLMVSRLTASKHIEVVIEAFNKLKLPLIIVGTGPMEKSLRRIAERHICLLGEVDDVKLRELYATSQALIQASEEDFGLVTLEALACGTPIIAYSQGAVREVMEPGKTGEFFHDLIPEAVADGVRKFLEHSTQYDTDYIQSVAMTFSRSRFEQNIQQFVND